MSDKYIIQRCIDAAANKYVDVSEQTYNRDEMLAALEQYENAYSVYEFRGHNISNCKCHAK